MRPGPTLSLLFPSFAYHILSITARQYQTARHAISDTCAFIDTDLASVIGINRVDDDTNISIQSCLCLSTLSSFVRTDPQVHDAVLNFGEETISDALEHFVIATFNILMHSMINYSILFRLSRQSIQHSAHTLRMRHLLVPRRTHVASNARMDFLCLLMHLNVTVNILTLFATAAVATFLV